MGRKKICIVVLVILAVIAAGAGIYGGITSRDRVSRLAAEKAMELYEKVYGRYYKPMSWTTRLCHRTTEDGMVEELFWLEVQTVMNVEAPEEWIPIQGMIQWCEENGVDPQKVRQTELYHKVQHGMENEQMMPYLVKAVYQKNDKSSMVILVEDGASVFVPFEDLTPDEEQARMSGYRRMGSFSRSTAK